jgi:Family of unknown function (DUF5317)
MGFVAALALLLALLRRHAVAALRRARFRRAYLLPAALGLQVLVVNVFPRLPHAVGSVVHLVSYGMLAVFLGNNIRLPGIRLTALGAAANAVTITVNGGVLPASAAALRAAGWDPNDTGFANSASLASPHLAVLGDNYVTPSWVPFANVYSLGDVLIIAGVVLLVEGLTRRRPRHRTNSRQGFGRRLLTLARAVRVGATRFQQLAP